MKISVNRIKSVDLLTTYTRKTHILAGICATRRKDPDLASSISLSLHSGVWGTQISPTLLGVARFQYWVSGLGFWSLGFLGVGFGV